MAAIVALGIVGGSAINQIGQADAGPRQERQMLAVAKQQLRLTRTIAQAIGTSSLRGLRAELGAIQRATEGTESALDGPLNSVRKDLQDNGDLLENICRAVRGDSVGISCF